MHRLSEAGFGADQTDRCQVLHKLDQWQRRTTFSLSCEPSQLEVNIGLCLLDIMQPTVQLELLHWHSLLVGLTLGLINAIVSSPAKQYGQSEHLQKSQWPSAFSTEQNGAQAR